MKASGQASDGEQLHPSFSYLNKTTRRNHAFDQTPHKEYLISNQHFAELFEEVVFGFQFHLDNEKYLGCCWRGGEGCHSTEDKLLGSLKSSAPPGKLLENTVSVRFVS